MSSQTKILVIENEADAARHVENALKTSGYSLQSANNGQDGLKLFAADTPALVILSLGLPDITGRDMMQALRVKTRVPVVLLATREQEAQKVEILQAGADDYLLKPLLGQEDLLDRVRIALQHQQRRGQGQDVAADDYSCNGLTVDVRRRKATLHDSGLHLTPTEYDLLETLVQKAGQVVTHAELLREVWGKRPGVHDHYLRIYIQRLRQKLGDDPFRPRYIFTESGIGYRMSARV
ncbi:MAG: winged helix-turn-helix domain-containing protein [Micavibrio sp.]|nr:winged helix-turn-helix domain-containing protein [Micavibrio sp.]